MRRIGSAKDFEDKVLVEQALFLRPVDGGAAVDELGGELGRGVGLAHGHVEMLAKIRRAAQAIKSDTLFYTETPGPVSNRSFNMC